MTYRERVMAIFAGKEVDNIVYQPRLEHWYKICKGTNTLPDKFKDMSLLDVYDYMGCSIRSYSWFNPCLDMHYTDDVKMTDITEGNITITRWETPVGSVEKHIRRSELARHTEKFPIETPEDMKVVEFILRNQVWTFDYERFEKSEKELGDRAAPMLFIPRINLQRLFIDLMGFENTLYALHDDESSIRHICDVIDETDQDLIDVLCESPIPIINFGDNVDQNFLSKNVFETYLLPTYKQRAAKFHKAGKYVHAHWDGSVSWIASYAKQTDMDGIEALTPVPQGDITLDAIKDALGDELILLDGIPMTCFLPHEPIEELERYTREIIERFSPKLILGISDEPSPVCDIERVKFVMDIVNEYEKG
ncbi:MAG: uroporphyrinogen decarboxylase family protein [Armatimonadota bacterium]